MYMGLSVISLNIIAVICFSLVLWGWLAGKIKKSAAVIKFILGVNVFLAVVSWMMLFSILHRNGLL